MCLAQGRLAVTLEPAATRSRVKHYTNKPLRYHGMVEVRLSGFGLIKYEVRVIFSGDKTITEDIKDKNSIKVACRINLRFLLIFELNKNWYELQGRIQDF